jgi:hypothetical protein
MGVILAITACLFSWVALTDKGRGVGQALARIQADATGFFLGQLGIPTMVDGASVHAGGRFAFRVLPADNGLIWMGLMAAIMLASPGLRHRWTRTLIPGVLLAFLVSQVLIILNLLASGSKFNLFWTFVKVSEWVFPLIVIAWYFSRSFGRPVSRGSRRVANRFAWAFTRVLLAAAFFFTAWKSADDILRNGGLVVKAGTVLLHVGALWYGILLIAAIGMGLSKPLFVAVHLGFFIHAILVSHLVVTGRFCTFCLTVSGIATAAVVGARLTRRFAACRTQTIPV